MLLTIKTTYRPATDLGFLLHKHPGRAQSFQVTAGTAHVFYPAASATECTAALLVEVDPIAQVRRAGSTLTQYVNDRPYAAGSQLAVTLRAVFGTAMTGRCDARPGLTEQAIPLELRLPSLAGDQDLTHRLFEPLGWQVEATQLPLDQRLPGWGESRYADVLLTGRQRLADALLHLYVLLPVLDGGKHYWVGEQEVDKLLRAGEGWLSGHPERELITKTYLAHRGPLVGEALARLADAEGCAPESLDEGTPALPTPSLAATRQETVHEVLRAEGAQRVLDLGCGDGVLLRRMLGDPSFTEVVGVDVSARALDATERKLGGDRLADSARARLTLRQSALTYVDPALTGYDAAVLMEVIEHLDESRLPAAEHAVFSAAHPRSVVVTTPNAEYNVRFDGLPEGAFRHSDHRFEWDRARFRRWADDVAGRYGYTVHYLPVGQPDPEVGPPTQLAVFTAREVAA